MQLANGLKKAGTFKDNVLMGILTSKTQIDDHEQVFGPLPQDTRLEMEEMVADHNPEEDQSPFLRKELKPNQFEEKTLPNTLLMAQEAANAPFGGTTGVTRDMFVSKVKAKDAETQYEK